MRAMATYETVVSRPLYAGGGGHRARDLTGVIRIMWPEPRNFQGSGCKKAFQLCYMSLMAVAHHSESPTARWLLHQK